MYLFFTVLCRAPSLHWSILNNELHLSGSRIYGMVLVYGMADSCLYNKQNNTWTLGDMDFIFSCSHSISHSFAALTRSISMWTLEDKFHISAQPCIILYLFKIFLNFWLAQIPRLILHNQLVLTKFVRCLQYPLNWHQ